MSLLLLRHATAGHRRPGCRGIRGPPATARRARAPPSGGAPRRSTPTWGSSGWSRARTCAAATRWSRWRRRWTSRSRSGPSWPRAPSRPSSGRSSSSSPPSTAVLCTHGDILGLLLGEEPEKGSTWVVDVEAGGGLTRREYLAAARLDPPGPGEKPARAQDDAALRDSPRPPRRPGRAPASCRAGPRARRGAPGGRSLGRVAPLRPLRSAPRARTRRSPGNRRAAARHRHGPRSSPWTHGAVRIGRRGLRPDELWVRKM